MAGPGRSVLGIVNKEREFRGKNKATSIPQSWGKAARQWRWRERAEDWDEAERKQARVAHTLASSPSSLSICGLWKSADPCSAASAGIRPQSTSQ